MYKIKSNFMHFQKMVMPAQMKSRPSSAKRLTAGTIVLTNNILWNNICYLLHFFSYFYLSTLIFSVGQMKESNSQDDFKIKVPLTSNGSKQ